MDRGLSDDAGTAELLGGYGLLRCCFDLQLYVYGHCGRYGSTAAGVRLFYGEGFAVSAFIFHSACFAIAGCADLPTYVE